MPFVHVSCLILHTTLRSPSIRCLFIMFVVDCHYAMIDTHTPLIYHTLRQRWQAYEASLSMLRLPIRDIAYAIDAYGFCFRRYAEISATPLTLRYTLPPLPYWCFMPLRYAIDSRHYAIGFRLPPPLSAFATPWWWYAITLSPAINYYITPWWWAVIVYLRRRQLHYAAIAKAAAIRYYYWYSYALIREPPLLLHITPHIFAIITRHD